MLSYRAAGLIAVLTCPLTALGCDESLSTVAGPTPNLTPTFSSIQRDIFETQDQAGRAACVTCHATPARGGLSLAADVSYNNLVNRASSNKPGATRVIPGDPDNSYLIQKLEGAAGIVGVRMPQNGPPYLTPGQIQIIRRWIEQGAPNN
jgi:hypothetical protein